MAGESSAPAGAVFLSYASEDAEAAQRISEALRSAGIEVWFDRSELRGGDAWDQKIRRELRDCALFVPVISAHTAARHEGYFRLEWDIADQRSHMIARDRAFIVPVCVDATPETSTDTPESFQRVQWTRLHAGEASPAFVERVQRLLSGESSTPIRPHAAAVPAIRGQAAGLSIIEALAARSGGAGGVGDGGVSRHREAVASEACATSRLHASAALGSRAAIREHERGQQAGVFLGRSHRRASQFAGRHQ